MERHLIVARESAQDSLLRGREKRSGSAGGNLLGEPGRHCSAGVITCVKETRKGSAGSNVV